MKLNVGCGKNIRSGWTNLDLLPGPGVDITYDLEQAKKRRIPLQSDSVEEFLLSHVIEHVRNTLPMMEELYRVATNGAVMKIHCPHGASDDAWEDPTHVRAYFPNSFGYFSQPFYWRADYGYRGDWYVRDIEFVMSRKHENDAEARRVIQQERNAVVEMRATLIAIKPPRPPLKELQEAPIWRFSTIK